MPDSDTAKTQVPWTARVLTLFPEMFPGSLGHSLAGKALEKGLWALETLDIREFSGNKHRSVDDTPSGGGAGMVLRADILGAAIDESLSNPLGEELPLMYLSPRGRRLDQARVEALSRGGGVTLICGRYEGIDERVLKAHNIEEVSLGDFVLSGGEPAAIALIDAVVRLLPGVMHAPETLDEESFTSGLLEYPHYTRPQEWAGLQIPEVLASGHHGRINLWRRQESERLTRERRPDLWTAYLAAGRDTE